MRSPRAGCAAVTLDERRILVAGGANKNDGRLKTTELLDIGTMQFTDGPEMGSRRACCRALRLDARRCLIVGGLDENEDVLATTEILDVETMAFLEENGPSLQTPRFNFAAVAIEPERALVLGGYDGRRSLATTEILGI